jgi:hypothetical protein
VSHGSRTAGPTEGGHDGEAAAHPAFEILAVASAGHEHRQHQHGAAGFAADCVATSADLGGQIAQGKIEPVRFATGVLERILPETRFEFLVADEGLDRARRRQRPVTGEFLGDDPQAAGDGHDGE